MKKQMMITKKLAQTLPKLEEAYEHADPYAHIHYYHILAEWHWYVLAGEQVITNENKFWRYPEDGEKPNNWIFLAKVYSPKQYEGDKGWEIGTLYLSDLLEWEEWTTIPVEREYIFVSEAMSKCKPYS